MSLEIRPLAALYLPPPLQKNVLHRVVFIGSPGRYAHAYGICTPFYCISLKNIYGGYNAARDLISRDIALYPMSLIILKCCNHSKNVFLHYSINFQYFLNSRKYSGQLTYLILKCIHVKYIIYIAYCVDLMGREFVKGPPTV